MVCKVLLGYFLVQLRKKYAHKVAINSYNLLNVRTDLNLD